LAHINCTSSNMKFVVVQKVVNSGNVKWVVVNSGNVKWVF